MTLTVAIQMDPIEKIDINGDSTFALALEAQKRGHTLFYYGPRDLSWRDGELLRVQLRAPRGGEARLRYRENVRRVNAKPGQRLDFARADFNAAQG